MTSKQFTKKLNQVLTAVLLVVALLTGQSAWAESSWTVTNSNGNTNTFTIKRSEKGYEQTVHFRTISLSAYAGQHFTAVDMDYTFPANEDEKTVTVTEMNPSTNAYKYQTGASRKYGFEVTDRAGFRLAYAERSKTWGTSVTSSGVFDIKDVTIQTSEYTADDRGYDSNGYKSVAASSYCTSGTQAYLGFLSAQLRMTLTFQAKENDDAYEYLQLLFDNTSTCDNRSNCSNGDPGNISLSSYMAGFEMNTGAKDDTYRTYTFPVTSVGNNEGATDPWGYDPTNHKWPLKEQKFKSGSRASDGRIIVPMNFSSIVLRLNASGSSGSDEWAAKNVIAHIQAIDGTAPTKLAVSVAPGRHSKGNTVYVSVAFSEIVTVTGTPTLTTTTNNNWGSLTYVDGSGTNVLTFSTTIPQNATGNLNITGLSGTVKDLAGNSLSGVVTASSVCTLDDDFAYTINDFQQEGGNYLIKTHEDLIGLAGYVNGGGATKDKTFLQVADIAFAHTTNWNSSASTENNYTAIGYYKASNDQKNFEGTYDGGGHTISGIRIYRNNNTDSDNYQGLFGHVKSNGAIRNVNLSDTRITGRSTVGGIVGYNMGTVEDCTVAANVCIHQIYGGSIHGGVVGYNLGSVKRCISSAHLTVKNGISTSGYGGIVGRNEKSITDCIATDVVIPDVNARGAIVGVLYNNGTLTRNYYHGCKVASDNVTPSGVGQGTADSKTTSDVDGAQPLWAITLPNQGTALPGTDNATYDNGADINGVPYAKGSSVVNLSYDPATITEGYDVLLSVKQTSGNTAVAFTDNGDHTYRISMMPAADITVSVTEIPVIACIDADGNPQSHACTPIVEGTTSYQTLGRTEGWYVVNSDVTFNNQTVKFLDQTVHVILCDGAQFSINSGEFSSLEVPNGSLEILAQSNGSGKLDLRSSGGNALKVEMNKNRCIDINGGNIRIYDGTYGIFAVGGTVTIRRGTVSISGINDGIWASNIILGCSNVNDRIYAKTYNGTVTIADGQILSDGTDTYSGTLSSEQIAAIAGKTLSAAIPYIDADGTMKYKASKDLTFIKSSTSNSIYYGNAANAEGWYVVNSDVAFSYDVNFRDQAVHIILCDGATLTCETIGNYDLIRANNGSLAIYGQSHGSGTLSVTGNYGGKAIFAYSNIDFNGGTIKATSNGNATAIAANGNITIRRGNITAKAKTSSYDGISATTITLGCATTADHIYATSYNGTVTIADGQTLTDGNSANTYTNTLNDEQKAAIAGKMMMKALGAVSYIDENGQEQTCSNYIILSDGILTKTTHDIGQNSQDTWYVASGSYTYNTGYFQTRGHVHLILCDGAIFTVNASGNCGVYTNDNLSIYGQSQGTGTLTANVTNASGKAFYSYYGNLFINGGIINANGGEYGIYVQNDNLTVNGGSINATGTTSGIYARGNLTLGWNKLSDRITANSYSCRGTISVKEGQQLHNGSSLLSGTLYNHNGGNPTGDLSVLAGLTLKPAVPYIAADGTTQYCGEYTVLESSNEQFADYGISGQENWYVVSGNVTFDGQLRFNDSHSHLIVCDGAHLTASAPVANEEAIYGHNGGITIYGQTLGTGTITANGASNGCGIGSGSNITINGGTIIATGMYGFYSFSDIIINRGTVTVTGTDIGIHADGNNVTINGGIVNATGGIVGIYAGKTITLGWTNPTDRITVSSYAVGDIIASGHYYIRVKNGQTLTDGTNRYSGTLYDINNGTITGDASVLAGQTLQPCCSITLPAHVIATGVISQNGTTAYALPAADITLSAEANFALANVEVNGTPATDNGDGTWSFTMPAEDVTVTATVSVPYIDADGTTQYCASYTLIESSQYNVSLGNINNDEAWYVVPAGEVTISGRLYCSDKAVHLILCDGAELTVTYSGSSDAVNTPYSLTIYGQSAQSGRLTATATGSTGCGIKADEGDITVNGGIISATSAAREGIYAQYCSVTINRGSVTATSNSTAYTPYGIHAKNDITINGGIVSATGNSYGINATGTITLGWTNATDHIYASSYDGTVVVKSGQTLTDDTNTYSGSVNKSSIAGKTLSPVLVLADNADNTSAIATNNGSTLAVQLTGRTLYKDGDWNTLCLPFDLASLTGTPLEGATVKTLTSTAFADGTLTLNFTEDANNLTSIEAGKPYIVKWSKPDGYDGHGSDYDLQNPVFTGVTIESDMDNVTTDYVTFCGTYSPIDYACDNNSILFLGLHNTLYYPQAGAHIGACRAYFELRNGLTAASITNARLAFDDEEETTSMVDVRGKMADGRSDIYNLNGQKVLNPTKGLYIVNGRKVIIK